MDFVSPKLASDHVMDELLQFYSVPFQENTTLQDELLPPAVPSSQDTDPVVVDGRGEKPSTTFEEVGDNPEDNTRKRKIIHKEVERQRRKEMTTLYRSLRLLLPAEYLKGKRSISDHMNEAVKYIKHMENKMKELNEKRDELKGSSSPTIKTIPDVITPSECSASSPQTSVTVKPCRTGMEVVVSTAVIGGLPLSRVLRVLSAEGLAVVSCISTKLNEKLLHTIESEVSEGRNIDPTKLEQKLTYSSAV